MVGDLHEGDERVRRLGMDELRQLAPVLGDRVDGERAVPDEPVDGVAVLRLVDRRVGIAARERPPTLAQPVRPREQHLSPRAGRHLVGAEALHHRDAALDVVAKRRADLGDHGPLVPVRQEDLLARGKRHDVPPRRIQSQATNVMVRPMRVLITNDDGIDAPGLHSLVLALERWSHAEEPPRPESLWSSPRIETTRVPVPRSARSTRAPRSPTVAIGLTALPASRPTPSTPRRRSASSSAC